MYIYIKIIFIYTCNTFFCVIIIIQESVKVFKSVEKDVEKMNWGTSILYFKTPKPQNPKIPKPKNPTSAKFLNCLYS